MSYLPSIRSEGCLTVNVHEPEVIVKQQVYERLDNRSDSNEAVQCVNVLQLQHKN